MTQYTSPDAIPYIGSSTQEYELPADVPDITELVANAVQTALASVRSEMAAAVASALPIGAVIMWAGVITQIPAGFQLCNGQAATPALATKLGRAVVPDLRNKFIMGAGGLYAITNEGGANENLLTDDQVPLRWHNHGGATASDGTHTHAYLSGTPNDTGYGLAETAYHANTIDVNQKSFATSSDGTHTHTVNPDSAARTRAVDNKPLFYALAYIIKAV